MNPFHHSFLLICIKIITNVIVSHSYEFYANNPLILDKGSRYHLCNVPTVASFMGQGMSPNIFFGLSQGGTIKLDISVESYLAFNDKLPSRFVKDNIKHSKYNSQVFSYVYDSSGNVLSSKQLNRPIIHPVDENPDSAHMLYSLSWWPFSFWSEGNIYPGKAIGDGMAIPNTYLMVMDYMQWSNFINSIPGDLMQPANNEFGFVLHPHLATVLKVPITHTKMRIKKELKVDKLDRYVVFIYNPERHYLNLSGKVVYSNDGETDLARIRLSTDLYYVDNVILVFAILNFLAAIYYGVLLYILTRSPKMIYYFITANFFLCSIYMFMDYINLNMIKTNNYSSNGLYYTSNIFMKFQEVFYLFILISLALGWQVLRQNLTRVEHQIISIVCSASLYLGILEVLINSEAIIRFVVHSAVFVIILMAINFNWAIINSRVNDELVGVEAAKLYQQLESYRIYRGVFMVYLLKPALAASLKHIALRPVFSQIFVWDQHIFLIVNLGCNLALNAIIAQIFAPFTPKGLLTQIPTW